MNVNSYAFNSVGITVPDKENLLCFAVSDGLPTQRLLIPADPGKVNSQRTDLPFGNPSVDSACTLDILSIARSVN